MLHLQNDWKKEIFSEHDKRFLIELINTNIKIIES